MATGDITSVTVRNDGWSADVVIEGFTTGATYDFGSLGSSPATTVSPKVTFTVVSEGYSSSGVLGTITRTVYGTNVVRVPATTATIAGSYGSGTFLDGETITQATSGATGIIVGNQSSGPILRARTFTGSPDSSNVWTGGTSGATFTASGTPSVLSAGTNDELNTGSALVVRIGLSECIYDDDKNAAGGSGTDPVVTIAAAWCTNSGGASQTSNAATGAAVTNNSTLDYPAVIAQWAWGHTPGWRQVTAATSIGCIAYHGFGIACVALSATDAHSAVVSGTATTKTRHQMSASSLYYESYDLAVPVSSFTAGDDVTLRFIAYPLVGDANSIIDTDVNTTAANDIRGLNKITFTYSPTVTTQYVAQNGNDTTGDGSTGNPWATIGKALAQNPGLVYVQAGGTNVVDILGTSPASVTAVNYFIDVKPKPGDEATVSLTHGTTALTWKAKLLRYSGFTFSGGTGWIDGNNVASNKIWFENCTISVAGKPLVGHCYQATGCWYVNCSITANTLNLEAFGTAIQGYAYAGCSFTEGALYNKKTGSFVANLMVGSGADTAIMQGNLNGAQTLIENNSLYINNKMRSMTTNGQAPFQLGKSAAVSGMAVIGNLLEVKTVTASQPVMWIAADPNTVTTTNLILAHNTTTGERCNLIYNDTGTTRYLRSNIFFRNNAIEGWSIKSDSFGTTSGNRTGNWETMNGTNVSDNRYCGNAALGTFIPTYNGINVSYVTNASTFGALGFTDDESALGGGAGDGNYMPTSVGVIYGAAPQKIYQTYDLLGTTLYSPTIDIGAIQNDRTPPVPPPTPTTTTTSGVRGKSKSWKIVEKESLNEFLRNQLRKNLPPEEPVVQKKKATFTKPQVIVDNKAEDTIALHNENVMYIVNMYMKLRNRDDS